MVIVYYNVAKLRGGKYGDEYELLHDKSTDDCCLVKKQTQSRCMLFNSEKKIIPKSSL